MLIEVQVILVEIKTLTRTRKALTTLRSKLRPSLHPFQRHLPLNPTQISLLINERRIMGSTRHRESARPAWYPEHPGPTTNISARTVSWNLKSWKGGRKLDSAHSVVENILGKTVISESRTTVVVEPGLPLPKNLNLNYWLLPKFRKISSQLLYPGTKQELRWPGSYRKWGSCSQCIHSFRQFFTFFPYYWIPTHWTIGWHLGLTKISLFTWLWLYRLFYWFKFCTK